MGKCCSSLGSSDSKSTYQQPETELSTTRSGMTNGHQPIVQSSSPVVEYSNEIEKSDYSTNDQQTDTSHEFQLDINIDNFDDAPEREDTSDIDDEEIDTREWKVVKEFGVEGEAPGEFKMAKGIAVSEAGDIAVTEHGLERVYLFNKDGVFTLTTASSDGEKRDAKLLYPTDVAFTSEGHIAIADQSKYVKVFDLEGNFLYRFNIKGTEDGPESKPKAYSIEYITDGFIFVGDIRRKVIAVHKENDGQCEWINNIDLNIEPHFLATNMANDRAHILACNWRAAVVNAIDLDVEDDEEAKILFTLNSFTVDGAHGLPKGLACDDHNRIYIAVSKLDDSGEHKNVFVETGHIHQYSRSGTFQRCLLKGLYHPRGLAWFDGSLYVANTHSLVILRPEEME